MYPSSSRPSAAQRAVFQSGSHQVSHSPSFVSRDAMIHVPPPCQPSVRGSHSPSRIPLSLIRPSLQVAPHPQGCSHLYEAVSPIQFSGPHPRMQSAACIPRLLSCSHAPMIPVSSPSPTMLSLPERLDSQKNIYMSQRFFMREDNPSCPAVLCPSISSPTPVHKRD